MRAWFVRESGEAAKLVQPSAGPVQTKAAAEVTDLLARRKELAQMVALGSLSSEAYREAQTAIDDRLAVVRPRAIVSAGRPATARLLAAPDRGAEFDRLCEDNDPDLLRAVLKELLQSVVIVPGLKGTDGLRIVWSDWASAVALER